MASPFFISYIPLINYQIDSSKLQKKKRSKCLGFIAWSSTTPLLIIFLMVMEFVFIFQTIVLKPLIFIVKKLSCGRIDFQSQNIVVKFQENIFELLFGMKKPEIAGFRRLRTITQLIFETVPEFLLQLRIYFYLENSTSEESVSLDTIKLSILFGMIHGVLEVLTIWIEAKVFQQPFFEYFVICFNGRLGWVPMLYKLNDRSFLQKL